MDTLQGTGTQTWSRDIRQAWRGMRRNRSFTFVAVVTLALGIGVTAAVFSIFYAVLLHPLPFDKPEQLAVIWANFRSAGTARAPVSGAILREIQNQNRSFSGVAAIWTIARTFLGDNPEQVKAAKVTTNFFDVLGVRAQIGQTFQPADEGTGALVLSDSLFRRRFAGNQRLIGKGLPLGETNTLVGILPVEFQLHFAPDANVPPDIQAFDTFPSWIYAGRDQYFLRVIGRLKQGVSLKEAQVDVQRIARQIRAAYPEYNRDNLQFTVTAMQADAVEDVKPALNGLFAGALLVLSICCVNVTGLLVTRATDRQKEMALRFALGASRGQILRQLLIEGGMLCASGGILGLASGWAGFRALIAIRPQRLSYLGSTGFNWPVLVFVAVCSLSTALLFGLVPAGESFRVNLMRDLRASGRSLGLRMRKRSGNAMVIFEVSLAFILVIGASLAAQTLFRIERVRPGFQPWNLLAFQVSGLKRNQVSLWQSELAKLPGVESLGATSHLPFDTDIPNWYSPYKPEPMPDHPGVTLIADLRCVTPGYFGAMGTRLISGRFFNEEDRESGQQVVIVDDLLARNTWPGQSALGRKLEAEHVTDNGFRMIPSVVVGVVEHVYSHSLTRKVRGQVYMPFEQSARSPLTFVLRTRVVPLSLVPAIRRLLHRTNKSAAIAKVHPMTEYVAREISPASFTAVLSAIFAGLALSLATLGIYGVLNYRVLRRMPEIGIRMALGATAREVVGFVIGESFVLVVVGLALGVPGALLVARWLQAFLFGVSVRDPLSFTLAILLLLGAALLGSSIPAVRAARVNPAEIIRAD